MQLPSGWHGLPPEASSEIEAAQLRGENVAIYEQCRSKKQDWWDTCQMDFANMQQTNLRSGTRRIARRIVDAGVEEPSPAMPAEVNTYGSLSTVALEDETLRGVWQEPNVDRQRRKKIFDSLRTCYRAFRGRVGHHASLLLRLPSAKECGRLAMDRSDSTLEVCCHLGIATEHAIYACSFATALCRLCYRASYKIKEACEQIFASSACSAKQTCARVRPYPTKHYLSGVHAQVS